MWLGQKAPAALTSPSGQRRGQESGWSQDGEEESMPGAPGETPNHTRQSSVSHTLLTRVLTPCCVTGPLLSITRFNTFCTQVPTYHTASVWLASKERSQASACGPSVSDDRPSGVWSGGSQDVGKPCSLGKGTRSWQKFPPSHEVAEMSVAMETWGVAVMASSFTDPHQADSSLRW